MVNKIEPVPKRKTILAWTLVMAFAVVCIGLALFAENSVIFGSSDTGDYGPSAIINTSKGTGSTQNKVTDGVCATSPTSAQCGNCSSALGTVSADIKENYGTTISTTSAETAKDQIDDISVGGNMSQTEATKYKNTIISACESTNEPENDPCTDAKNQLTTLSKDGTVPALQTKLKELVNSNKSSTEIANTLNFYTSDDAGLITSSEYPLQADEMSDIADLYEECANSICTDAEEQLTALSRDTSLNDDLETKLNELLNSSKSPSEISSSLNILKSDDAGLISSTAQPLQYDEMTDISELYSRCAQEKRSGATDDTGGQTDQGQSDDADGDESDKGTEIGNYSKYFKWMMIAEMLKSIIAGDWETALTSAIALGLSSDDVTRYASMLQAANNDPGAFAAYVVSDLADGNGLNYRDLDQIASTGTTNRYNQSYLQQRATEMANDLFKIDAITSVLSSVGDLISNFMGDEEAAEFQEKWDGSLESLQEIMTTITTLNYSDIAGLANNSLYNTSQYQYGTSGTATGDSSATNYATSVPVTETLLSSLSETNSTFYIVLRQPLSNLEYNIQRIAGSIIPTSRGILFLSQYNTLYRLIQSNQYGEAIWQLIN